MTVAKIKVWLKELINTPSVSIKNIKDSNISIKINGKEKINYNMDAKKEALKLKNNFWKQIYKTKGTITFAEVTKQSIKCALISIESTIKALEHNQWMNNTIIKHYREVEQEINKL